MKKKSYPMWQEDCDEMGDMDEMSMKKGMMPQRMILAHAYVPWQYYDKAFSPQEALMKGTLFPELWGVYPIPE
ncbi:hypothetical protein SDC9_04105 [bioreactor metagenome]|uniref:Spore coat associated protein JA (CotJA) n=1 Tax=bioreactor metagenome TaxID=1076179 RepID=A0A644SY55_9ZZZZ|nr:spore coat associated protein CotJA [Negativicutes bacterium]